MKTWVKELETFNDELRRAVPFTAYEFEETQYPAPNTRINYFPNPRTIIQVLKEGDVYEVWHWVAVNDKLNAPLDLYDRRVYEMVGGASFDLRTLNEVQEFITQQFAPIAGRKKS